MIALITAALGVISILLEMWVQNSPQRQKEKADEATQQTRADIAHAAAGDPDAVARVNDTLDQLQSGEDCPQGEHRADDLLRDIQDVTGASVLSGAGSDGTADRGGEKR